MPETVTSAIEVSEIWGNITLKLYNASKYHTLSLSSIGTLPVKAIALNSSMFSNRLSEEKQGHQLKQKTKNNNKKKQTNTNKHKQTKKTT